MWNNEKIILLCSKIQYQVIFGNQSIVGKSQ
jgi:hypothetical protein